MNTPRAAASDGLGPRPQEPPGRAPLPVPAHIALVMDGSGRWATHRDLPRTAGNKATAQNVFETIDGALSLGVPFLTVFLFSTENWRRSREETTGLLAYLEDVARRRVAEFVARGVRVRWCGSAEGLPASLVQALEHVEAATASDSAALTYTICVNYGGRADLVHAARGLVRQALAGGLRPDDVDESLLATQLMAPRLPDVDLLIRTGGEQRLSNFMLWQCAYAELVFLPLLWPNFTRDDLRRAVDTYTRRERRFGATGKAAPDNRPGGDAP